MNDPTCDRAPLVEALFDGRLGPSERTSTERHLKTCSPCAELLRDLTSLREILRSSSSPVSPLEHQRARLALLRETATPPVAKRRSVALLIAGLLTLPFAVWASASMLSPLRVREVAPVPAATNEPATRGRGVGQARSSREEERADEIAASPSGWPVASSLPAEAEHESAARGRREPAVMPTSAASSSFITPRSPASRARVAPSRKAAPSASAPDVSQASTDFAEAVQALSRGDFSGSAIELDRFSRTYPGDARAEDAAYLSAIALERDGRSSEAKAAARRYLTAYPDGAHAAQARRIAGD